MFTIENLAIFKQPGSWEKVIALQEAFFPKLVALQEKSNKLIKKIYGIDINDQYKFSATPTISSRKGQIYNPQGRYNDNQISVGLRGKGLPSTLSKPDGKICQMHFALLAFSIGHDEDDEDEDILTVLFNPYILKYAEHHRLELSFNILIHKIEDLIYDFGESFLFSHQPPLAEMMKKHKAYLCVNSLSLPNITQQDLAKIVIIYAACFPMLDLFTRLSNGENLHFKEKDKILPNNNPDYAKLFRQWHQENAKKFIHNFYVEPITEEEIWKSEAITRSIFEELLGKKFAKTRPSWLKSDRSNANLELDGYCEELKLAFEYQGEYHYIEIPVHHQQRTLQDVQKNDKRKLDLCQKNGIDLIQVPFWKKGNREYIIQELYSLNRPEINQIVSLISN